MATFDRRGFIKGALIMGAGSVALPADAASAKALAAPQTLLLKRNEQPAAADAVLAEGLIRHL